MKKIVAVLAVVGLAGAAHSQVLQETFSSGGGQLTLPGAATPITGSGGRTYAAGFSSFTSVGGYNLGRIRLTGTVIRDQTPSGDTPGDNRVNLWSPGSQVALAAATHRMIPVQSSWGLVGAGGTLAVNHDLNIAVPFDPTGAWAYDFYHWFDDGGGAGLDSHYTDASLQFFDDQVTQPTTAYDFGTINTTDFYCSPALTVPVGGVVWAKFTITQMTSTTDIFSFGSDFDTEIGLYSAGGALIQNDDDFGGTWSRIGIGTGSGYDVDGAGSVAAFGATNTGDGAAVAFIGPGTYFVSISGFNTAFGPTFGVAADVDAEGGTAFIKIIPSPGAFALIGMGGLLAARRRRA